MLDKLKVTVEKLKSLGKSSTSIAKSKTEYVLGFMFSPDRKWVALIKKEKPEWQKGFLNGLGGHVEKGETIEKAMAREFLEEAMVKTIPTNWTPFARMESDEYIVYVLKSFNQDVHKIQSSSEGEVKVAAVDLLIDKRNTQGFDKALSNSARSFCINGAIICC